MAALYDNAVTISLEPDDTVYFFERDMEEIERQFNIKVPLYLNHQVPGLTSSGYSFQTELTGQKNLAPECFDTSYRAIKPVVNSVDITIRCKDRELLPKIKEALDKNLPAWIGDDMWEMNEEEGYARIIEENSSEIAGQIIDSIADAVGIESPVSCQEKASVYFSDLVEDYEYEE